MGKFRQGWELTKKSWAVLRSNRQLFPFPIYRRARLDRRRDRRDRPRPLLDRRRRTRRRRACSPRSASTSPSFVGTFFGVGLAATADGSSTATTRRFGDGMAVARSRIGAIAGWAALSALVGILFALLRQGGSIGEVIIGSLGAAAWSLITFLAVPVIAIEGLGPVATLKRSASLFKERWAGQVTGNVAIGGIVFLVGRAAGASC